MAPNGLTPHCGFAALFLSFGRLFGRFLGCLFRCGRFLCGLRLGLSGLPSRARFLCIPEDLIPILPEFGSRSCPDNRPAHVVFLDSQLVSGKPLATAKSHVQAADLVVLFTTRRIIVKRLGESPVFKERALQHDGLPARTGAVAHTSLEGGLVNSWLSN